MPKSTFYITTPIYYSNSAPHVGSAYTTVAADVIARWNKLLGKDVFFLTGLDEHGKKIQETAQKQNKTPQQFVDEIAIKFKEVWKKLDIEYNNFVRTTDDYHVEEVKKVFSELHKKGIIYRGYYEALYCVGCEQYKTESDLVDGKCPLHNRAPELKKEESYMLKLSSFQDKLLKVIEKEEFKILPKRRRNEVISFIKQGLKDVSVSRKKEDVTWGIEVPFDNSQTIYVWVDAFWNYVSGLRTDKNKRNFWPVGVQLMANDILRVHSTIWPAMLLGLEYKLPKTLFVHGYFTVNGQKMSKSLGNVLDPIYLSDRYGTDQLRYFLFRNIPFGEDGDFSEKQLVERINNELVSNYSNLFYRIMSFIEKNFNGKVPKPNKIGDKERETKKVFDEGVKKYINFFDEYRLNDALSVAMSLSSELNRYFQEKQPWEKIKTDRKDCETALYTAVNYLKIISGLLYPFMPSTSIKALNNLGIKLKWKEIISDVKPDTKIKSEMLFKKIELK